MSPLSSRSGSSIRTAHRKRLRCACMPASPRHYGSGDDNIFLDILAILRYRCAHPTKYEKCPVSDDLATIGASMNRFGPEWHWDKRRSEAISAPSQMAGG